MSSIESRKKKGNGGIRIFQRSLKEMYHGNKQPKVQLSHDKTFRNLSKNEMEELSGDKHEQTLNKEKMPYEKICKTNLHSDRDMECKSYQVFPQKTPTRFWNVDELEKEMIKSKSVTLDIEPHYKKNHLSVEYDSRKISSNSFENNNYYSNSYKRSCERNSDCPKFSQSNYRIKSNSSHNQSYMGPQNQSHHSNDQSNVHSRVSHVCTFNHSHVTHSNSGSDSCLVNQARNAPGGHRVFQPNFHRTVKGSQDYDIRHQRQYSHSHKQMYDNKNENLRYNGAPQNFHNSQIQFRNNYDYSQNNSNMNQNVSCVPRHTKSEDWSSELLNISDWNNNVREEHIEEVLKKEWMDNVINKKESFVSKHNISLTAQKSIETKEDILSECNSFEENKQTYENKATEKNSEVNLLEKCRGESETAVLIHCQTDVVNYEIEQWLPAENLLEREINPDIENKDEGKCAVKEILNCSTGKEDIETNDILNFNESENENICLSKTNEVWSEENKVECDQLVSNIKLNTESMVRENSGLNFEDTGIGLDQWTDEISSPNDKYMLNTSTVQTNQHSCTERTNKYDLIETEHELSQTENTIAYTTHEPVETANVETESVVIECEHELIATDHEVEIVEKECQLNETEGSINKSEYELIDTDHEHDETQQKLSSNVNEDTSKQGVVVTKVTGQENKCRIFYVDGEAIIDQMESNVEENSYEGSAHLECENILHAEECKMKDENQSDKSKFGDRNNADPSMPGECHTVLNQEYLNALPEVIEDTECNKCAMDMHLSVQRKDEYADPQKEALMLEKKGGIVVENHCPVESNSDCVVEAQTVLADDSDISTHGVLYDDLIKEKMKDMENEVTTKLGSKKNNTNQKSDPLYDFLAFPDFENRGRSKSLPESPYMQIVELMQQFKHKERERNILLEKSHTSIMDLEHACQFPAKSSPVIGRGKVTVSLSPYDNSPVSSCSQSVSQPGGEDWETDLIPIDQYFMFENLDKKLTDDRAYDEILDSMHECKPVKKLQTDKVPVNYPYMKLENEQAQQTSLQCNQKPFISKGRGCLSPEFRTNLIKFLNARESEIPFHHKKGFAIQNYNNPKIVEKIENMDLHTRKKQQEVSYSSPENWENTFNDIDSLELTSPGKCTPECQEDLLIREVKEVLDDKVHEKQNGDIKSSNHEEQVIFKKPQTIENENFEPIECYIRNDSASMSSLPQCELLSPKSQSTLSGVPTMSDYENSDIDTGPLDIEKNDFQDDIFNQNCLESLKINSSEEKRFENKCSKRNHNTDQFLVNETVYDTSEKDKLLMEHGHESELGNDFTKDEIDHHFMSYYYPDLSSCRCHPSVQQYWVWHSCMCHVPRLCEIRTCQDYWLQNPFGDMDGIHQTVPIPDVNNNRKREPVNKKSWCHDDGPAQNKQDWSIRRGFTPPGFPCRPPIQVIPPPMPFSTGMIPPPNPHQSWERMYQHGPAGLQCRMKYRGPKPKENDIPVHLVHHNSQQSCKTVVSPFVCAQGFYQNISRSNIVINTENKNKSRHKSETENVEQNDSGVVVEVSPGFIGPVMPQNVKSSRSTKKSVSPMSAIRELLNEGKSNPVEKLVDYPYSETDESEDDRSRSSVAEKRQREETESTNVTDNSNSESESSKRPRSNVLGEVDIKHFKDVKKLQFNKIDYARKFNIPNETEKNDSEISDSDESEDGSSKFHDCSSTLSNYQILQTVLNEKFPKKQSRTSSKVDVENDMLDLTDDGSEIISVASQESSHQKVKPTSENNNNRYSPFWASSNSVNDSPGCGYPAMFPPYMYPGWVSPEMISAKYGSPCPETEVLGYQRRRSTPLDALSRRSSTDVDVPSRRRSTPLDVPSRRSSTSLDVSPRKMTVNADQPCISPSGNKTVASQSEDNIEERFRRGNLSIRGMDARLRFHRNSKLLDNPTTFQTRITILQKSKQTETDSDSQSSLTSSWKLRYLNKCRSYKGSYIDSHCHLDFLFNRSGFGGTWTKFKKDNADTMPYNFEGCVAVFCHPSSFRQDGLWSEIAEEEDVWLTFGCHPKNATEYTDRTEINLKMCLLNSKVVALGEIGLDYSGIFVKHKEVQQIVFKKQIQIALDMNKPLVIHCREAEEDALTILDEMVPKNYKIHCHCFTGTYESAKKWMDMFPNLFIGLTPLVTYKTATSTHEVARFIPLERLLLETDAPYFVPRKCPRPEIQYSHPGFAITVAEEVAWLKKCPIQEVLYSCRQNTRLMYGI